MPDCPSLSPLFTWRSLVSSDRGPDASTTRHVLLALSLHMNEKGGSCFPSTRTLSNETGLSRRTVEKHLRKAEGEGWLRRDAHGFSGQGWKRYEYAAKVPQDLRSVVSSQVYNPIDVPPEKPKGGEARSPRSNAQKPKGGESDAKGGESNDNKVGKEVPTRTSIEDDSNNRTLEHTGELFPELSTTDPPDPVENVVEAVWEATLEAWRDRVGKQPGPDLKATDGRLSKIRARARECLQAGMQPQEAIRYLTLAAQGFYADDWERRDEYLDPGRYCFADDEKVRGWVREGRQEELGLSDADLRFARRYERLMAQEAEREDSA